MKKTLKILSLFCALVLIIGTVSVGMSAYAVSDDIIGSYDFEISNVYKDVNWSTVKAYKAETHVHTERSDGDQHVRDMIKKYYELGFDAMCLTDHGTVNYGWTEDQTRHTVFDYQFFVHGSPLELSEDDYKAIITGTRERGVPSKNAGNGMMELPLGIELNGMSTNKCHVNGFYADAGDGDMEITTEWPQSAVVKSYEKGGFTHINHVGEWSEGNDSAGVYNDSWLTRFTSIYENYCPNRGGRGSSTQTAWMNSHMGEAGCIGMELVNTADSRTHNDRRYVYDEILKRLAPKGINVFGFCEDDSHEYSDCDRNAQYFLISDNVSVSTAQCTGVNCQRVQDVQQIYRDAMFYGEFYASSKNSKNSYELGNGFVAVGEYPSVSNIVVDQATNQIKITCKDATKARLVADGDIIDTQKTDKNGTTVVFDLNSFESKINSYVRVYLTGAGGITYLQPFLVKKVASHQSTVQFVTPSTDTEIVVKDSAGSVVSESCKYANHYYILPAGSYTYTASRRGYVTKTEPFTIEQSQIDNKEQVKINVELEEVSDTTYAYFYVPETIYVDPAEGRTFDSYIDRDNAVAGALNANPDSEGNVFFYREGASDIRISYDVQEGSTTLSNMSVSTTYSSNTSLTAKLRSGLLTNALANNEYVLIRWTATYMYKGITYYNYAYSYVYKLPVDNNSILGAGARAKTKKNITTWSHTEMETASSIFVVGCNEISGTSGTYGYKYQPYGDTPSLTEDSGFAVTGSGFAYDFKDSSGGSEKASAEGDTGIIYCDRSRINNFSQIPYFMLGYDLNYSNQCTGEDGDNAYARLQFNDVYLMDVEFSSKTAYTYKTIYNGVTETENLTASKMLDDIGGTRLYLADNKDENKKLNMDLPPAAAADPEIQVLGEALGSKESRTDTNVLSVNLQICNVNKSNLRMQVNDTIKYAYQREWFQSETDWNTYQAAIVYAAKVLGNPASDAETIEGAMERLETAENALVLKTGTATVKHYWRLVKQGEQEQTGLIFSENSYTYSYSDNLTANALEISGYRYANKYECYVNGVKVDEGTSDFDLELASKENYEWRFYYTPNTYVVNYKTGVGDTTFPPTDGTGYIIDYGQPYTITTAIPSRTGYTFAGWYLDLADETYSSGAQFSWDYASDGDFVAQWNPIEYTVSYDVNGGTSITVDNIYKKAVFGSTYAITPEVPSRTGYIFTGWKLNDDQIYTPGSQVFWQTASNSTFVAQWEKAQYTVTFDPVVSDATVDPQTKQVKFDSQYGTLTTATRTGYTASWYSNPNYTDSSLVTATSIVKIPDNHTLYAKWTANNYEIYYNLDGGAVTGTNPLSYTIESKAITLLNPAKTGYNFLGWSGTDISSSSYSSSVTIPAGSIGDRSYTAHWSISGYQINYNLDGGLNDSRNPATYNVTDRVIIYPATKSGYTFLGWSGSNGSTPQGTFTIPEGTTGNKTYDANWKIINYNISYNYAGGSVSTANPATYDVNTNDITLVEPEKSGYTFYGWECSDAQFTGSGVVIPKGTTGDLSFKALWTNNDYTVTYILNGGSVNGDNPIGYTTGDSFTLINPTRNGYNFGGWKKTIGGKTSAATTTAGVSASDTGNVTFEAVWNAITYNISYSLGGGRIATAATNPTTYSPESAEITLINPIRTGYEFTGWTGTGLSTSYMTAVIPSGSYGERSYTANWKIVDYSISYDLNGGADTGLPKAYNDLSSTTIGQPIRMGYTFTGWNINYEGFTWTEGFINLETGKFENRSNSYYSNGIVLRAGRTYTLSTASSGGRSDLRLRVFNLDGTGYQNVSTSNYTPSTDCVAYILAYQNHTTEALRNSVKLTVSGTPTSYSIPANSTGSLHLVANWQKDVYTLTYQLNGGDYEEGQSNPDTYNSESDDIVLNNPVRTGYDFIGWDYNGSVMNPAVISRGSTGNRTYSAVWQIATYSIAYGGLAGATIPSNPTTYTIETESFTLANPTRTGYSFEGWVGTDVNQASTTVTISKGSIGNRSFTATWTPVSYTISYNLDGGKNAAANPNSYTIESATFSLSYPTKTGAVFAGWSGTDISGQSTSVSVPKGSTGNRTYTANWTITTYDITYNLDGGTEGSTHNPVSYTVQSDEITLARPERTGYEFTGWTGTGLSGVTEYVTIPKGSTGHRSYTANWRALNYTISYDLDGGVISDDANPKDYTIETTTFILENPTKAGYLFTGWTGTDLTEVTPEVTVRRGSYGNRSYVANWAVDGYTISYELNEGVLSSENPTFYTIASPDIKLNNPERAGYEFIGWSGTGVSGTGVSTDVVIKTGSTGNRRYEANWKLVTYNLSYNLNGGSEVLANPTTYTFLSAPITLFAPVKTGYVFQGWISDYYSEVKETVTINTGSTGDKSFEAVWSEGNFTITYNLNGGSVATPNPTGYKYTDASFTLTNPTKEGYTFLGWSGTGISGTVKTITIAQGSIGDRNYVANWTASANALSYNLEGGAFETPNPESYITNSGELTINNPSRKGYVFDGWTYDDHGKNIVTIDSTSNVATIDTRTGGAVDFTAHWRTVSYKISYNLNGGRVATANPRNYTVESNITLNNPTRTGYVFKGWSGTGLGEYKHENVSIPAGSTGNRNYTANWEEEAYTITYDYDGGSTDISNPTSYTILTPTITLNNPVRTGYKFLGWTGSNGDTPSLTVSITTNSTGNKSYVANWEEVGFTISYYGIDGAIFTATPVTYKVVSNDITLKTPVKPGYEFLGWKGTGLVNATKTVVIPKGSSGDREYTAQWKAVDYSVNYNLNGGQFAGTSATSYTIESPKISVLTPSKSGYSFEGWNQVYDYSTFEWTDGFINMTTGAFGTNSTYPNSKYAEPVLLRNGVSYTLSGASSSNLRWRLFNLDGTYITSQTVTTFTPDKDVICFILDYSDLGDSVRSQIKLTSNVQLSSSIKNGSMGDLTYIANWNMMDYTISYAGLAGVTGELNNPTSYNATQTITLNNPSKVGYTFAGWTGTGLSGVTKNVVIPAGSSGNRTYTANWKTDSYTITVSLNGGTISGGIPETYTIMSNDITLPTPKKTGYTFIGWKGTGIASGTTSPSVVIRNGSTGNRSYEAVWEERVSGTHKITFYGYSDQVVRVKNSSGVYEESQFVSVGSPITVPDAPVTVGYKFVRWDKDVTSSYYRNLPDDIEVHGVYEVDPEMSYKITVNNGKTTTTTTCTQYQKFTASADASDSSGNSFSYWIDTKTSEIVSYYRNYTFSVHEDATLNAVYGVSTSARAATRITIVEGYKAEYDWFTVYTERSVSSEYTMLQHGLIFTNNASIGQSESNFTIGASNVYNGVASTKGLSGIWTLSIPNPAKYSGTIYLRSYVKVADADGNVTVKYSAIKQYLNNEDPSA